MKNTTFDKIFFTNYWSAILNNNFYRTYSRLQDIGKSNEKEAILFLSVNKKEN